MGLVLTVSAFQKVYVAGTKNRISDPRGSFMSPVLETKGRGLAKAITYRIICVISLLVITWLLTRDLGQSIYITAVFQTFQTVVYYLHERAWALWAPVG